MRNPLDVSSTQPVVRVAKREYLEPWSASSSSAASAPHSAASFALPADLTAVVAEWRDPGAVAWGGGDAAAAAPLLLTREAAADAEGAAVAPPRALARAIAVPAPSAAALRMASQLRLVASFPNKVAAGAYLWEAVTLLPAAAAPAAEGEEEEESAATALYAVRLFVGGAWRTVVVDGTVPVDAEGRCALPCAAPSRGDQGFDLWPVVLCKAYLAVRGAAGAACAELAGATAVDNGFVRALTGWLALPVAADATFAALRTQGAESESASATLVGIRAVCTVPLSGIAASNDSVAFSLARTNDAGAGTEELRCARPADIYIEWRAKLKAAFDATITDAKLATAPRDAVLALLADPVNAGLIEAAAMKRPGQLARMQQGVAKVAALVAAAAARVAAAESAAADAKAAGDKAAASAAAAEIKEAQAAAKEAAAPPPPMAWEEIVELFDAAARVPRWITLEQFAAHFDTAAAIALHHIPFAVPTEGGAVAPPPRHAQINAHFFSGAAEAAAPAAEEAEAAEAAAAAPAAEEGEGAAAPDAAAAAVDDEPVTVTVDAGVHAAPDQLILVTKPCEILFNLSTAAVRAGDVSDAAARDVFLAIVPVATPLGVKVIGVPLLQMRCSASCAGLGAATAQLAVAEATAEAPLLLRVMLSSGVAGAGCPSGASLSVLCLGGTNSEGACSFGSHIDILPKASSAVSVAGVTGSVSAAAAGEYRILFQQTVTAEGDGAQIAAALHISDPSIVPSVRVVSQTSDSPLPFALPLLALPDVAASSITLTAFCESAVALPPFEWQLSVASTGTEVALAAAAGSAGGDAGGKAPAKKAKKAAPKKGKKGAAVAAEEDTKEPLPTADAPLSATVYKGQYVLNRAAVVLSEVMKWGVKVVEGGEDAGASAPPIAVRLQVTNPSAHLILELLKRGEDGSEPEVLASSRGASSVELVCSAAGELAAGAEGELLLVGRLDTSRWNLPSHLVSPLPFYCCNAEVTGEGAADERGMAWRLEVIATPTTGVSLEPDTSTKKKWDAVQAGWDGGESAATEEVAPAKGKAAAKGKGKGKGKAAAAPEEESGPSEARKARAAIASKLREGVLASNEIAFIDAAASVTAVKEESAPGASDECDDDEEAVAAKAAAAARAAARLERLQRLPPATIVEIAPAAAAKEEKGPAAAEEGDSAAAAPAETKEAEEESKEEKPDLLAIIASSKKQTIASFDEWQTRFAGEWTELWAAREAHRSSVEQLAAVACDAGLATAQSASKMAEDLTNAKTFDAEIAKLIAAAEKQKAAEEKAAAAAKAAEEKAAAAAVKEAEKKAAADAKAAAKEAKKKK